MPTPNRRSNLPEHLSRRSTPKPLPLHRVFGAQGRVVTPPQVDYAASNGTSGTNRVVNWFSGLISKAESALRRDEEEEEALNSGAKESQLNEEDDKDALEEADRSFQNLGKILAKYHADSSKQSTPLGSKADEVSSLQLYCT